jgi:hypothetical protein
MIFIYLLSIFATYASEKNLEKYGTIANYI